MGDGSWYWVSKSLLRDYAKDIGALGIAVYSCLASFVDSRQTCFPTQEQIGEILGYSRASVNKAIRLLEIHGLIVVSKRGRHNCIYRLTQVRCKAGGGQVSSTGTRDVKQADTNDNHVSRININNDTAGQVIHRATFRDRHLAMELADALNDRRNLGLYISFSRKYPESLLRAVIRDVLEIPSCKIRKSRAALFNYLMQRHEKRNIDNTGR